MRQDEVEEERIGHSWKQLSKSDDGRTYIHTYVHNLLTFLENRS